MSDERWRRAEVAPDGTHHVAGGAPLYPARFAWVLRFHAPGLAPAGDASGAFHITAEGKPAYAARYLRTFGFYEGLASAETAEGFCHLRPDGAPASSERYAWCGNYQEGRCAVRLRDGRYTHLDGEGRSIHARSWRYAGDFREGAAVVQRDDGLHTHVDARGEPVHGRWFEDLDVFHKGFARARDGGGWHHVDRSGRPGYARRFAMVEPFYNGQARAERKDGALEVVDEAGHTVLELRPAAPLPALSSDMVGFWRTQTILAAVELSLFDALPAAPELLAEKLGLPGERVRRLLRALWELELVEPAAEGRAWAPTSRGQLLARASGSGMDAAARVWGRDHFQRWTALASALRSPPEVAGEPGGPSYFEQLRGEALSTSQRALDGYARQDYAALPDAIDWSRHQHVVDAGGGRGALLRGVLEARPHLTGTLIELPEVVQALEPPAGLSSRLAIRGADLFQPWPVAADAIVLARVLHDWPDADARRLLLRAKEALAPGGRLYVIELVLDEHAPVGGLLDLNMLVMTGGRERTAADWERLLTPCGLRLEETRPLSRIQQILVVRALDSTSR